MGVAMLCYAIMLCAFWEFSDIGDARYEGRSVRVRVLVGCGSATGGGWSHSVVWTCAGHVVIQRVVLMGTV